MMNLEKILKGALGVGLGLKLLNPFTDVYAEVSDVNIHVANNRTGFGEPNVEVILESATNPSQWTYTLSTDDNGDANPVVHTDVSNDPNVPDGFDLQQNYPNPFNPSTAIEFSIDNYTNVQLNIFDDLGRHVKTLVDENMAPGNYKVNWNAKNKRGSAVAAGRYHARLVSGNQSDVITMINTGSGGSDISEEVTSGFAKTVLAPDIDGEEIYHVKIKKDGFVSKVDSNVVITDGMNLEYNLIPEGDNLILKLNEPFGNSTKGIKIYNSSGLEIGETDSDGKVVVDGVMNDKIYIGDGSKIIPGEQEFRVAGDGADMNLDRTVVMSDYPMKYLIKFMSGGKIDDPNNSGYVKAWHPSLVNADSTLKGVKYLNVPEDKLEDFISQVANVNANLRKAGSKHLYPMPDETNLLYRSVSNAIEEGEFADSLRNDLNTPIFYLCGEYNVFPGSGTNANWDDNVHYATKGNFNTSQDIVPETFFEEACTTMLMMNGESMDNEWLWTIFGGGGVYDSFRTTTEYHGKNVIAEELIIRARDNLPVGTKLTPNEIIYTPLNN